MAAKAGITDKDQDGKQQLHAIQLIDIKVRRLHLDILTPITEDIDVDVTQFTFTHGHTPYDPENNVFIVMASVEIGIDEDDKISDDDSTQIAMRVDVAGFFKVDESRFPVDQVEDFARRNAPLIIYPFLREHTYGLLNRAGINGIVLPLFQVPLAQRIIRNSNG